MQSYTNHWMNVGKNVAPSDHDLVYQPSRWQRILWREVADEIGGKEVEAMHDDLKARPDGLKLPREAFSRLYGNPERLDKKQVLPEDKWAESAHDALDELPEWKQLRERCRGDKGWAGLTTVHVTRAAAKVIGQPTQEEQKVGEARNAAEALKSLRDMAGEKHVPGLGEAQQKAEQELQDALDALAKAPAPDQSAMRQAMREALAEAQDEIKDIEDAESALGTGGGGYSSTGAGAHGKGDIKARMELARRLRDNKELRKIIEEAGRLRRIHADKRATRSTHAPEELCDIEIGGDINRLLPHELAALRHPVLKLQLFRKLLERNAAQYRLRGNTKLSKGPLVVLVDESGSMNGHRNTWAKAVSLAMLQAADAEKRGWCLIKFDTRIRGALHCATGKNLGQMELLEALSTFSGGGTAFRPPLDLARKIVSGDEYAGLENADILLVTDGSCSLDSRWAGNYRKWLDDVGATMYGILIGSYGDGGVLNDICDQVTKVEDMMSGRGVDDSQFIDSVLGAI